MDGAPEARIRAVSPAFGQKNPHSTGGSSLKGTQAMPGRPQQRSAQALAGETPLPMPMRFSSSVQ
ncbi:hypothetical protein [Streptomyces sp. NPDC002587]